MSMDLADLKNRVVDLKNQVTHNAQQGIESAQQGIKSAQQYVNTEAETLKKRCPCKEQCDKILATVSPKLKTFAKKVDRMPLGKILVVMYGIMTVTMSVQTVLLARDGQKAKAVNSGILSALWGAVTVLNYLNEKSFDVEEDEAMDDGVQQ